MRGRRRRGSAGGEGHRASRPRRHDGAPTSEARRRLKRVGDSGPGRARRGTNVGGAKAPSTSMFVPPAGFEPAAFCSGGPCIGASWVKRSRLSKREHARSPRRSLATWGILSPRPCPGVPPPLSPAPRPVNVLPLAARAGLRVSRAGPTRGQRKGVHMTSKWCRVCVREITGSRSTCERCRSRQKRARPPAAPEARLVRCASCHREYALPFGVRQPTACSGPCEERRLEWAARNAEVRAARVRWKEREVQRHAASQREQELTNPGSEAAASGRLVREVDPRTPWSARSVWR